MFYQVARILLTPTVAGMNFWWYGKRIPRKAGYALGAQCAGVFVLAWFDSRPSSSSSSPTTTAAVVENNNNSSRKADTTTPLGVFLSFAGVLASSLYTIWVAEYHKRWEMNSMQLLHNQSWLGALLLMYGAPFEISAYLKGRSVFIDGGLGIGAWWGVLLVRPPQARELSPVSFFFFVLGGVFFVRPPFGGYFFPFFFFFFFFFGLPFAIFYFPPFPSRVSPCNDATVRTLRRKTQKICGRRWGITRRDF